MEESESKQFKWMDKKEVLKERKQGLDKMEFRL